MSLWWRTQMGSLFDSSCSRQRKEDENLFFFVCGSRAGLTKVTPSDYGGFLHHFAPPALSTTCNAVGRKAEAARYGQSIGSKQEPLKWFCGAGCSVRNAARTPEILVRRQGQGNPLLHTVWNQQNLVTSVGRESVGVRDFFFSSLFLQTSATHYSWRVKKFYLTQWILYAKQPPAGVWQLSKWSSLCPHWFFIFPLNSKYPRGAHRGFCPPPVSPSPLVYLRVPVYGSAWFLSVDPGAAAHSRTLKRAERFPISKTNTSAHSHPCHIMPQRAWAAITDN